MKRAILVSLLSIGLITNAQQSIDISTGIVNLTGGLIATGSFDDTWTVTTPAGTLLTPKATTSIYWSNNTCSKWITPKDTTYGPMGLPWGDYTYKTNLNVCFAPTSAMIEFTSLGADNEFQELRVNGHSYPFNFPGSDDNNPLLQNYTVVLNPSDVVAGNNLLEIVVRNRLFNGTSFTQSGMNICGVFKANGINAGQDKTICPGNCVIIGPAPQPNTQYTWTYVSGGSTITAGNTAQINVCPGTTTNYTLTATNTLSGCTATDVVQVATISPNDPSFNVTVYNMPGLPYFTCRAMPVVTNANTVAGFGEMYYIELLNTSTGQYITRYAV
jgi:hypothetical protein